jgi:hypothetical protein
MPPICHLRLLLWRSAWLGRDCVDDPINAGKKPDSAPPLRVQDASVTQAEPDKQFQWEGPCSEEPKNWSTIQLGSMLLLCAIHQSNERGRQDYFRLHCSKTGSRQQVSKSSYQARPAIHLPNRIRGFRAKKQHRADHEHYSSGNRNVLGCVRILRLVDVRRAFRLYSNLSILSGNQRADQEVRAESVQ